MTCIAWDGKTLAADRRVSYGTAIGETTKIFRIGKLLVGGAGDAGFCQAMIEWVRQGRQPATFPVHQTSKEDWVPFLVVEESGAVSIYERAPYPTHRQERTVTIGCGRDFAKAAMHLGLSAKEAVAVAIALDSACGNGVDTLEHGE